MRSQLTTERPSYSLVAPAYTTESSVYAPVSIAAESVMVFIDEPGG